MQVLHLCLLESSTDILRGVCGGFMRCPQEWIMYYKSFSYILKGKTKEVFGKLKLKIFLKKLQV
jgi:hypothetical protein